MKSKKKFIPKELKQKIPTQAFYLRTKKALGQHLLVDSGVLLDIADLALEATKSLSKKQCIEIGPGAGALTRVLLENGLNVNAIEIDTSSVEGLRNTIAQQYPDTFEITQKDVLRWEIPPFSEPPICIGNLPYYITSEIILWFCRHSKSFTSGIFMIQDEVAHRLNAKPSTKAFGRLSIRTQLFFHTTYCFKVPPTAFRPPPKVNSAVIHLKPTGFTFHDARDEEIFDKFSAFLFSARRKMLNKTVNLFIDQFMPKFAQKKHSMMDIKEQFWKLASTLNVTPDLRPDALTVQQFRTLQEFLHSL